MTESAAKLLDLLHARHLLPDLLIDSLRKQVAAAPTPLQAHHIAKLLQQKGKITAFQARELLAAVEEKRADSPAPGAAAIPSPTSEPPAPATAGEELDLALVEEDIPKTERSSTKAAATNKAAKREPSPPASAADAAPSLGGVLDDLLGDPARTTATGAASGYDPLGIAQPQRKRGWLGGLFGGAQRKPSAGGWESPLFIVGGGALLLLVIVGAGLALVLLRSSGEDLFKAAELDYANGAYGQAIAKYEKFLSGRANHPQASLARVRIGLARLRAASASGDANVALKQAQEILPALATEPSLAEARPELASLLPGIAEKYAEAAAKATDTAVAQKHVAQYRAAMKLIDDPLYLPTSVKAPLAAQLDRMQQQIDAALREIEQADRLRQTIAAIAAAVDKQDPAAGYEAHRALVSLYPRLSASDELREAVAAISGSLAGQVRGEEPSYSPAAEDHPSPAVAEVALATPSGRRLPLAQRIVPMVIDGVLYVVAADDGGLLWRRFVGRDVASARLVGDEADSTLDVLVVDAERQELLRLRGHNGTLAWRLPLKELPMLGPAIGQELLVTLPSGKLLAINLGRGRVARQIAFPQRLAATAARVAAKGALLQCGEHSNLYVLDAETFACSSVHYLGHKAGTIDQPPQAVGPLVVVPQQAGLRRALLHVLAFDADDSSLHSTQKPLAIDEQIALPLLADGSRAAVFDRRGAIRIVEAQEEDDAVNLAIVAEKSGSGADAAPLAALADGMLIVADGRLAGHRIRTARGTLPAVWANHDGDRFIGALHVDDDYVFYARRPRGEPGAIIAAAALAPDNPQDAGQPVWQTHLAMPPAGAARQSATGEIEVASAAGERFVFSPSLSGFAALNKPLAGPSDAMPARHALWCGGELVPNDRGQIEFIAHVGADNNSPPAKLFPLQPPQRPGEPPQWLVPAAIDEERFVAAERRGHVHLVCVSDAGALHLAAQQSTKLDGPLVAGPAVSGQFVVVVERGADSDKLVALGVADWQPRAALALGGRVAWGPRAIGDLVLVAVAPQRLIAIRAPAVEAWQCDLGGELPTSSPVMHAGSLWLATTAGRLWQVSAETGEPVATINFAQPLAAGPAIIGERVVVRASDGTALLAELPR